MQDDELLMREEHLKRNKPLKKPTLKTTLLSARATTGDSLGFFEPICLVYMAQVLKSGIYRRVGKAKNQKSKQNQGETTPKKEREAQK